MDRNAVTAKAIKAALARGLAEVIIYPKGKGWAWTTTATHLKPEILGDQRTEIIPVPTRVRRHRRLA